jgi:DNA repair photolyase
MYVCEESIVGHRTVETLSMAEQIKTLGQVGSNEAPSIRVHRWELKAGITCTPEFEKKGLATHAVNVGTKCGHGCLYCSTGAVLRTHKSFRACGENPFGVGYAIVDPQVPERVARGAKRIRRRGLVQLCTLTDAWAPEAHEHRLGRRCLEAILSQSDWTVRILTKNASIRDDFDLIESHRDRVLVGVSITAALHKAASIQLLEPNASSIQDRMLMMVEAAARGLRTYAMLCPLLPGIADSPETVDRLVKFAVDCRAEEIFVEPMNPRGPGLRLCQEALEHKGFTREAKAMAAIRQRPHWSQYVAELVSRTQQAVREHSDISKLRFLLYPWGLRPEDKATIQRDDAGVVWLGKKQFAE